MQVNAKSREYTRIRGRLYNQRAVLFSAYVFRILAVKIFIYSLLATVATGSKSAWRRPLLCLIFLFDSFKFRVYSLFLRIELCHLLRKKICSFSHVFFVVLISPNLLFIFKILKVCLTINGRHRQQNKNLLKRRRAQKRTRFENHST